MVLHALPRVVGWASTARTPTSLVLTATLIFICLNTLGATQRYEVPFRQALRVHSYGDPGQAIHRIQTDNITTIAHLNELAGDPTTPQLRRDIYRFAPILLVPAGPFPTDDDTFIGVYYTLSQSTFQGTQVTTIQYWYFASDENEGTVAKKRLALFGQPIDRELIYQVRLLNGEIVAAHFQAPIHKLVRFDYDGSEHPIFRIASGNHNFALIHPYLPEQWTNFQIIAPMPRSEAVHDPAHDPDFVALAAGEALRQHDINLSEYVYMEFQNPVTAGRVTVSVLVDGRWYYLHDSIAGLTRPGYNQIAIYTGFTPLPSQIERIWVIAQTRQHVQFEVFSVYLYPQLRLPA